MRDGIHVNGHRGTWYVVEQDVFHRPTETGVDDIPVLFLEHEKYGDEVAWIVIDEDGEVVLEDVWNGVDDLREYEELLRWKKQIKEKFHKGIKINGKEGNI